MIHSVLSFINNQLNDYLKQRNSTPDENWIFLTSVATESKGIAIPDKSLGLSLINIEEDRIAKDQITSKINDIGNVEYLNPEIKLNLYILVSANFQDKVVNDSSDDYVEGLKQLSYIISFFQTKNVFTPENSPVMVDFEPKLKKIVVELYSYSFEQLYNFWSVVGTNYLPSVLFKIRMVTIQEDEFIGSDIPIKKIDINSKNR